ncbi:MAG: type II toxin-antitoxin system RelE/ParE family toxin [Eubacteriales bacterium]|nr:type II toxin-antitoxin system RelE/ParE family toxin [Eubacteriales bacterium]
MTRTFIQTQEFVRNWERIGLTDEDLRRLELEILKNPKAGAVIPGTGRLRKMRFAFEHTGKSGSSRVCYVDFKEKGTVYLITVYAKNEKENLSMSERNAIKKMVELLESRL